MSAQTAATLQASVLAVDDEVRQLAALCDTLLELANKALEAFSFSVSQDLWSLPQAMGCRPASKEQTRDTPGCSWKFLCAIGSCMALNVF